MIADKLQTIQNIKENIKTAINNKGGNVGDDFTQYSTAIDGLSTGGGITKIDIAETGIKFGYSTFKEIPDFYDFSNITNMQYMFYNCTQLQTIPELDCSSLESSPREMFYGCTYLTNVGGFTNLRYSIDLGSCVVLSQQSLNNIISKLIPVEQTRTIRFYTNLEGRFSEEMIASATEKNWIISFSQFTG